MNDLLSQIFSAGFIFIVIRVGTPLVYASMSSYIGNLAGISNIAVDGIMNFGALFGIFQCNYRFSMAWMTWSYLSWYVMWWSTSIFCNQDES